MQKFLDAFEIGDVRYYLYGIASAALYLLAGYGLMSGELVLTWGVLFAALFNIAQKNVDRAKVEPEEAPTEQVEDDTEATEV